jgi:hypothetical protein
LNAPWSDPDQHLPFCGEQGVHTESRWRVLLLLLKRELVKLATKRKLAIHELLVDVEVLHIEEPGLCCENASLHTATRVGVPFLAHSAHEHVHELTPALGRVELGEVDGDKLCPLKILLHTRIRRSNSRSGLCRRTFVSATYWYEPRRGVGTGIFRESLWSRLARQT